MKLRGFGFLCVALVGCGFGSGAHSLESALPASAQSTASSGQGAGSAASSGSISPAVTLPSGAGDIGAQINAAAAAFNGGSGSINLAAQSGCYVYATPIVLPDGVSLSGASIETCLQYMPTSGTALTIGSADTLSEFMLLGSAGTTSATGLLLRGNNDKVDHLVIGGNGAKFHIGLTFDSQTYLARFYATSLSFNDQNAFYPAGLQNAGENIAWFGGSISNGGTYTNCFQNGVAGALGSGEFEFYGVSFDTCQVVNNEGMFKMHGGHFEDGGVAADHPFLVTYNSNLDSGQGVRVGSLLDGVTIFTDANLSGTGFFEVDRFGSLSITGLVDTHVTGIPLVQLGNAAGDSPFLQFQDAQNVRTQAQLYSVYPGASPFLNISTPYVQQHASAGNHVFSQTSVASLYGYDSAVVANGANLGMYKWSGNGQSWFGQMIQADGNGGGFKICGAGTFSFSGYGALGTEAENCATHLGLNSVTSTVFNSNSGYQVGGGFGNRGDCLMSTGTGTAYGPCGSSNGTSAVLNVTSGYQVGGSFGAVGDCLTSTGAGSVWEPCAAAPVVGSSLQAGVLKCGTGVTCVNGVISFPGTASTGNGLSSNARTGPVAAARASVLLSSGNEVGPTPAGVAVSQNKWMPAAVCSGGVAVHGELATYDNRQPRLGCYAPASSAAAYLAFEAQPATPQYATATFATPANWTGSDIALLFAGTAMTGNVTWTIQAGCSNADNVLASVSYGAGVEVTANVSTTPGGLVRTVALPGFVAPAANGCVAGSLVTYRISRASSDTQAGDAHLLGAQLTNWTSQ